MQEGELKEAVRKAVEAMLADGICGGAERFSQLEEELAELMSREKLGSDREAILKTVRECVAEMRQPGQD